MATPAGTTAFSSSQVDNGAVWDKVCKIVNTGHILRIVQYERLRRESYIVKLPGKQYCIKKTGEVLNQKTKSKTRSQNLRYVRQSMQHGRDMVNTNIRDLRNCIWLTFTYAENMTNFASVSFIKIPEVII